MSFHLSFHGLPELSKLPNGSHLQFKPHLSITELHGFILLRYRTTKKVVKYLELSGSVEKWPSLPKVIIWCRNINLLPFRYTSYEYLRID